MLPGVPHQPPSTAIAHHEGIPRRALSGGHKLGSYSDCDPGHTEMKGRKRSVGWGRTRHPGRARKSDPFQGDALVGLSLPTFPFVVELEQIIYSTTNFQGCQTYVLDVVSRPA